MVHRRCAICCAQGIETIAQARPIFRQLVIWIGEQGLRYNDLDLQVKLVDAKKLTMRRSGKKSESGALGMTFRTYYNRNGKTQRIEIRGVAVRRGLPEMLFKGVVAHELGHVWLGVHGITGLSQQTEEGFCELLAYRLYTQKQSREGSYYADNIERNPDPTYGEGFRKMHKLAQQVGFERLVVGLLRTKSIKELN